MEFNVEDYLSNVSYIDKDFVSLWDEVLETIPKLTSKWTPSEANESDPLVVLLKELTIIADKLNYNIDKNILELFPATLTQTRSAYNVYDTLGYTPDWYVSATTSVTFNYNGMIGDEVVQQDEFSSGTTIIIPRFTSVSTDDSDIVYTTMENAVFNVCEVSKVTVDAIEGVINDFEVNGSTQVLFNNLDSQNKLYFTESNVAQNGIFISNYSDFSDLTYEVISQNIENEGVTTSSVNTSSTNNNYTVWTRVDNLNQYMSGNKIYKLGIDPINGSVYLQFPDDIGELIEDGIYIKYITSSGESGNIGKGDLSKFLNNFEVTLQNADASEEYTVGQTNFSISNTKSSQNGADPLTIEEMHEHFNRTVGVFNTLVTLRDYENYIYEYTDSSSNNVVSNIRVTDRYNDLENSVTYKTMLTNGTTTDIQMTLNTASTSDMTSVMTAYDLKLYPLYPEVSIDSKDEFDYTFNRKTNADGVKDFVSRQSDLVVLDSLVQTAINSAKCVSHDFVDPCNPILIPYNLSGQIYLKSPVSTLDASEVLSNVEVALYENLNSRELKWGEQLLYGDIVDVIKDSDNRISYVGLDAIEYGTPLTDYNDYGYDVVTKSILAGVMPWSTYEPYSYDYGMDFTSSTTNTTNYVTNITGLTTAVEATATSGDNAPSSANMYIVNTNETFTIITPQYQTITQYANYLYVLPIDNGASNTTIEADRPTVLESGQTIYIYESKTTAQEDIENIQNGVTGSFVGADYKIKAGSIIKSTMALTFTSKTNVSNDALITLGSSGQINVLQEATGTIQASNDVTGASTDEIIYVATTSKNLQNTFNEITSANGAEYTLLSDEYLFYTDRNGSELGIIGEGTTLKITKAIKNMFLIDNTASINSLTKGNMGVTDYTSWTQVSSGLIEYALNELHTFGANYVIYIDGTDEYCNFGNYVPNKFFEITGNATIKYQLATVKEVDENEDGITKTYTIDSTEWNELDKILNGENSTYKALTRVMLVTGPGVEQTLYEMTSGKYEVIDSDNDEGNGQDTTWAVLNTIQKLTINSIESVTSDTTTTQSPIEIEAPQAFQTSMLLAYEGGTTYNLDADDEIGLLWYEGTLYTNSYESTGMLTIKEQSDYDTDTAQATYKQYTTSLDVPGTSEDRAIVYYISTEDISTVKYLLVDGNSTLYFAVPHTITIDSYTFTIYTAYNKTYSDFSDFIEQINGAYGSLIVPAEGTDSEVEITGVSVDSENSTVILYTEDDTEYKKIQNGSFEETVTTVDNDAYLLNDIQSISRPYMFVTDATYYHDGIYYNINEIENLPLTLDENYLYVDGFCPLITPSSTEKIEDPMLGKSYFLTQHPLNKFCLPYLNNIDDLAINPASISN